MRGPVSINGGTLDAIVDIGSSISSISASNARRLGLRPIAGNAVIGTATEQRQLVLEDTAVAEGDQVEFLFYMGGGR